MSLNSNKRLQQLDILRAIAVFLVFGNHMTICPPEVSLFLYEVTSIWKEGGWIGVDMFFVLSGFLVSGLLFREYQKQGKLDIKRFLIRRGFKIYPSFWVLILGTCITGIFINVYFHRWGLLGELLFIQNYGGNLLQHTWTLAVEEHFYITLCVLFYVLLKRNPNGNPFTSIPKIFAFVAVVCLGLRLLTGYFVPHEYVSHIEPTHLRMDSLFFGVFLAYLWHFKNLADTKLLNKYRIHLGLLGLALLVPAFIFKLETNPWVSSIGLTLFYVGSGCVLLFALKSDLSKVPFASTVAYLGTFSYSLYLWNIPVQNWIAPAVMDSTGIENWFFYFLIFATGNLALGIGLAKAVEYPFLELRNKIIPQKVSTQLQTAEK